MAGPPNRRDTWRARAICDEMQFNPLRVRIARYIELKEVESELLAVYAQKGGGGHSIDSEERREFLLSELHAEMDKVAAELMPYLYEKPKSIAISGPDGGPVQIESIDISFVDTD